MSDINANNGGFLKWIKTHSYAIIVAVILISGDWALFNHRIDELEIKVEENRIAIEEIQISRAKDMSEIKTLLISIKEDNREFQKKFDAYDENIRNFYEKYDLKPRSN